MDWVKENLKCRINEEESRLLDRSGKVIPT